MTDYDFDDMVRAYDAYADERDSAGLNTRKTTHINEAIDWFGRRKAKTVLEIGSGPGNAAVVIRDAGYDIECVDLSPKMIELVREKGLVGKVLDSRDVATLDRRYDAVFSINSLLHIPMVELPSVLRGIRQVMNPSAVFVLGLWGGDDVEGVFEGDHYRPRRFFSRLCQRTLLAMLSETFQIEEYRRVGFDDNLFFHKVVLSKPGSGGGA